MAKVLGVGGVFFRSEDAAATAAWYRDVLGFEIADFGGTSFHHADVAAACGRAGMTVWSPFKADTTYFQPSTIPMMVNFIVDDLDAVLAKARAAGARQIDDIVAEPYGRFAWLLDGDGRKIELWEPADPDASAGG